PAGELLTDVLDDLPAPRLAFQGLRDHLAELVQPLTAAFTAGARRGFDDTFDRQVIWQGTSRRPRILRALLLGGFRCRDLGLGFLLGLGLFEILDGQLKLLDQQPAAFRKIARTALAVPWPASASTVRFPGGRRSLRSSPASAARAAKGSSHAQRQDRLEVDRGTY